MNGALPDQETLYSALLNRDTAINTFAKNRLKRVGLL